MILGFWINNKNKINFISSEFDTPDNINIWHSRNQTMWKKSDHVYGLSVTQYTVMAFCLKLNCKRGPQTYYKGYTVFILKEFSILIFPQPCFEQITVTSSHTLFRQLY